MITGASAGIGYHATALLLQAGHRVWGTSRSIERLEPRPNFHPVALDLRDLDSVHHAVEQVRSESGGIDVLINNAAAGVYAPLSRVDAREFVNELQALVVAPMELTRQLLPDMQAQGCGLIINITSLAAQFPVPFMGVYSAGKAALSSLSWTLEMELYDQPIKVVEIQPGDTRTQFHEQMVRDECLEAASRTDNIARAYRSYSRRMHTAPSPAVVARRVLQIIDQTPAPASKYVTGSMFQAHIGPFFARLGPARWIRAVLRRYYGLKPKPTG